MSHCKSAAIRDSFGHKGAFFLGELQYTESKLGLLSVINSHAKIGKKVHVNKSVLPT